MIANVRASIGDRINLLELELFSLVVSFVNSLTPSPAGCKSPYSLILFGPFRSWLYPRIFRSSRVKNAILPKIINTDNVLVRLVIYCGEDYIRSLNPLH